MRVDIQFDKSGHAQVSTLELGNLSRLLSEVPTAKVAKEVKKLMQGMTGDRAGSSYNLVMENTAASLTSQAWSGQIRPGLANSVRAYAINPFVKWNGVEFFGTAENFKGKATAETAYREWDQYAGELVYRFGESERFFVGGRANTAKGALANTSTITFNGDVSVDRYAATAGWYITPVLLLKGEYMQQKYFGFPSNDIRNGGKIQGFVFEGVVSF